jgi:Tfp pilus assembly protein FimT
MREKGFNFLDVTLSCLLLSTLAVLGIVTLDGIADQHHLQAATQSLVADLHQGRIAAIAGNLPCTVQVRADARAYSLTEPGEVPFWRELPRDVRFSQFPTRNVVFYSRGSATPAGTYTLSGPAGQIQVVVAASGRCRWARVM